MSKTPWTPGPWIVRDERSVGGDFLIVRPAPDGGLIDTLWMARPCLQGPETEANARLIAASPTMADYIKRKAVAGCPEAQQIWEGLFNAAR